MLGDTNYEFQEISKNDDGNKDISSKKSKNREEAVIELKKVSKSFIKEAKNEKREISSEKLVRASRNNFEVMRSLMREKKDELREKKWNPFAKITLYLAENHKIFLGELRAMHKIYKKYDKAIGLASGEIIEDLKKKGLYSKMSSKDKIENEKTLNRLGEHLPDECAMVIISQRDDIQQYLSFVRVKKDILGKVTLEEGLVRYLGNNEKEEPQFLVKKINSGYEETVTGMDELKYLIAFDDKEKPKDPDKMVITKGQLERYELVEIFGATVH